MQTPEEYFRQRSHPAPSKASSASQIAVFIASFIVVCVAFYFARGPSTTSDNIGFDQNDEIADQSDVDLIQAMESFLKTDDPVLTSELKPVLDFRDDRPGIGFRPSPDDLSNLLNDLSKLIDPYKESIMLQESALETMQGVQSQAVAIQQAYLDQKAKLKEASPQLLADLSDLKQHQATVDVVVHDLTEAERVQAELGADLQRIQTRVAEQERVSEAAHTAWRQHVDQKLTPLKETVDYTADRLARRLQEAKSSSGKVSVLRRELQTHSVILSESTTQIASLTHQKTILESRLKSIEQLGRDVEDRFSTNTDVSLQSAIDKQQQRLNTVKSEYSSLPDEPARAHTKNTDSDTGSASTELPGYKKKMMQIAVDEAERKLAWLQELQAISRRHGLVDANRDGGKEEALRSFIDLKTSEIANELVSTASEMESERTWQERIVTELNTKNEQLKVLEHDLSSDAISDLRSQADRAKVAHHDAEAEAQALERTYQQASDKVQHAQAEMSELNERLVPQREKVRHLHESKAALTHAIDLLRNRLGTASQASRTAMREVSQIRSRAEQLHQTFDTFTSQYNDADRRRRSHQALIRSQVSGFCRALE